MTKTKLIKEEFSAWKEYTVDLRKVLKLRPNEKIEIISTDDETIEVTTLEEGLSVKVLK